MLTIIQLTPTTNTMSSDPVSSRKEDPPSPTSTKESGELSPSSSSVGSGHLSSPSNHRRVSSVRSRSSLSRSSSSSSALVPPPEDFADVPPSVSAPLAPDVVVEPLVRVGAGVETVDLVSPVASPSINRAVAVVASAVVAPVASPSRRAPPMVERVCGPVVPRVAAAAAGPSAGPSTGPSTSTPRRNPPRQVVRPPVVDVSPSNVVEAGDIILLSSSSSSSSSASVQVEDHFVAAGLQPLVGDILPAFVQARGMPARRLYLHMDRVDRGPLPGYGNFVEMWDPVFRGAYPYQTATQAAQLCGSASHRPLRSIRVVGAGGRNFALEDVLTFLGMKKF